MSDLIEPNFLYCVELDIDPINGTGFRDWVFGGHIDEVVSFPGIQWARAIAANANAEDGWDRYMMVYAMESEATLAAYQASQLYASFKPVWDEHQGTFRVRRVMGPVVARA